MSYKLEMNEDERDLMLQTLVEMIMDKDFQDRELAGRLFYRVVYAMKSEKDCKNNDENKRNNTSI